MILMGDEILRQLIVDAANEIQGLKWTKKTNNTITSGIAIDKNKLIKHRELNTEEAVRKVILYIMEEY
jgi:hypothetical protein